MYSVIQHHRTGVFDHMATVTFLNVHSITYDRSHVVACGALSKCSPTSSSPPTPPETRFCKSRYIPSSSATHDKATITITYVHIHTYEYSKVEILPMAR